MLILLRKKATDDELNRAAEDLEGYVKFVVDIDLRIMTIGGSKHVDGEQKLLDAGSHQNSLWGGGLDLETDEIDFDSMINVRPSQSNPSREVLSQEVRDRMVKLVRDLLK